MATGNFLRTLRQLTFFTVMIIIAVSSYLAQQRSTSWEEPLWVEVYPIVADDSERTKDYISGLSNKTFAPMEKFMVSEASRYGVEIDRPIRVDLGEPVNHLPPPPPATNNPLRIALWSLSLRLWAYRVTRNQPGPTPDIRLFLVYHDPETRDQALHSLGLRKGMLGIINVFAESSMQGTNNVVIAHEMLHTLGATDKYAMDSNLPIYPEGYAEPGREPLHPQAYAEIMGGRVPLSVFEADIPRSLKQARVGKTTAMEIRWVN